MDSELAETVDRVRQFVKVRDMYYTPHRKRTMMQPDYIYCPYGHLDMNDLLRLCDSLDPPLDTQ